MTTTYCPRCDSTGLCSESVGFCYFEPPAERIVVCPEEGCKGGVISVECDGGRYNDPCGDPVVGKLDGLDFCAACMAIAIRSRDDSDPPDARDDAEYMPARRAS